MELFEFFCFVVARVIVCVCVCVVLLKFILARSVVCFVAFRFIIWDASEKKLPRTK